ncbi:MAG: transcriptional regulator [Ruminococcus sp.]|nr:transcriptional regulator [Ruminococcus sp.]
MKLVYAIVNSDDTRNVANAVTKAGFSATKLASAGGFLSAGNTTFLICTEDERVDELIQVIAQKSRRRKQFIPSVTTYGMGTTCASVPVEVTVGGATIFVTDVERFEKV